MVLNNHDKSWYAMIYRAPPKSQLLEARLPWLHRSGRRPWVAPSPACEKVRNRWEFFMEVSIVMGAAKNGWFIVENPMKMDDLGKSIYKWMMTRGTPHDLGHRHRTFSFCLAVVAVNSHLLAGPAGCWWTERERERWENTTRKTSENSSYIGDT